MSSKRSSQRDARLRDLLRQGDPAAEPGLATEELQAMRRTVLTAVPERRPFALIPTLATGAAVALAVLLAVVLWRGGEPQGIQPPEEKVAARPAVPPAIPPPSAAPEPVEEPVRKRQAAPRVAPPPPSLPEPEPPTELASVLEPSLPEPGLAEPRTRHVEFSTPGGTRIIWVLTEDESLLK